MKNVISPPGSTAVIYARSAMKSDKSIEDQLGLCGGYAAQNSWSFQRSYVDNGCSGTKLTGRKGLSDMLAAAERGEFQVLVISDIDRLSRSAADVLVLTERLKALGVTVCKTFCGPATEFAIRDLMAAEYRKIRARARARTVASKKQATQ